jgi:hypothetical protein
MRKMNTIFAYFLTEYLPATVHIQELDKVIETFLEKEDLEMQREFIFELGTIIKQACFRDLVPFIEEHSCKHMLPFIAELFIKYLFDWVTKTPTALTAVQFLQMMKDEH